MQRAVQRTWTPDSHWHIGDLAWQRPSLRERTVASWRDPDGEVVAWAWLTPPGHLELHAPPALVHAGRGLGAAVSLACLQALRDAGATLAVVCPRGDAAYPVPRALYHRVGFRDAGCTVTFRRAAA